jgi:hypothetical protein
MKVELGLKMDLGLFTNYFSWNSHKGIQYQLKFDTNIYPSLNIIMSIIQACLKYIVYYPLIHFQIIKVNRKCAIIHKGNKSF